MDNHLIMVVATVLMAIATVFSAISAMYSISFSKKQIEHNRNSVKPICTIDPEDYEDRIAVSLVNSGIGPLIVKKLLCENKVTGDSASNLITLMPKIDQFWGTFYQNIEEATFIVGEKAKLIEIKPKNEEVKYKIRMALKDISVYVEYEDIYGTKFKKQKSLGFFGRHTEIKKNIITQETAEQKQ